MFNGDMIYVTTTITPISEEIVKAIPVLFYALVFSDNRDRVMPIAFATGVGFATFENMVILVQNIESVTIGWAIIRGFSTALMHAVCTVAVGFGICFIRKRKKLFYCGTFALLTMACIYHGIFNMLVQSNYKYLGFVLPAVTYVPILFQQYQYYKRKKV
jgi:RsiW-degrading membrane proteinase PrsW (M82 family)